MQRPIKQPSSPADEALGHLFTRVNTSAKEVVGSRMFSEWAPVQETIQLELCNDLSVLNKFPLPAGMGVATPVVKHLASNLGISSNSHCEPSRLEEDKDVLWCMEVLSYGLGLPLVEHDTIRDSVNIYCEWLMALLKPKICVPKPICEDPNRYAQIMIRHFYGVFVPRPESNVDTINRQVVLCHRVLRTLQKIARESSVLVRQTWESMLMLLLAVTDVLLGPPSVKDDIGDQLCERVVSVLFEVWLLSCAHCFPSPSLWRTFRDMCLHWRHRINLVDQWNRVNTALTSKLLRFMYGPSFPELKIGEDDWHFSSVDMTGDRVAQSFFRFLHLLGNPVELSRPAVISNTPKFLHYAITSECVVDPCQHACLSCLPTIFLRAMRGIALLVDAFLGIANWNPVDKMPSFSAVPIQMTTVTPPQLRKPTKGSFGVSSSGASKTGMPKSSLISLSSSSKSVSGVIGPSSISSSSSTSSTSQSPSQVTTTTTTATNVAPVTPTSAHQSSSFSSLNAPSTSFLGEARPALAPSRPRCNSVLHLFGAWLFEAALVGTQLPTCNRAEMFKQRPGSLILNSATPKKESMSTGLGPAGLQQSVGNVLHQQQQQDRYDVPSELSVEHYESGRAEAIGALCRIFCAKKTGEDVLPVYLARFYVCLRQGLRAVREQADSYGGGQVLCGILLNSYDLLRLDLDGVMCLVPSFIDALELVLPERELKFRVNFGLSMVALRRASIHLLLSMLPLPLHFRSLPIKELLNRYNSTESQELCFQDLRPRLINLLVGAIQSETDSVNMQLLLGGLLGIMQDVAASEADGGDESGSVVNQLIEGGIASDDSTAALLSTSGDLSENLTNSRSDRESNFTGNDSNSETASEFSSFNSPTDSTYALFVRATYLVCQRLSSSWKMDLNVSLAALELLSGFAKIKIPDQARRLRETLECRLPVKWICDYIVGQCSRPPQYHSKDLHSNIVAAFRCVAVWLLEHQYLLTDPDCLATVTEVIELGISGSKSSATKSSTLGEAPIGVGVGGDSSTFCSKGCKECKPASMRVRDAAESLLAHVMEHVGNFPSPIGQASVSSLLDEDALVWHCRYDRMGSRSNDPSARADALKHFKYYAVDNSLILALLEQPLGNDQDPQPTVTSLMRGPFGRNAWLMQLRHLPRHKSGAKAPSNPGRPVPTSSTTTTVTEQNRSSRHHQSIHTAQHRQQRYFPDSVNAIAPCRAERSIPPLESLLVNPAARQAHLTLAALVEQQIDFEESVRRSIADAHKPDYPNPETECRAPHVCHEFETARLFLSHFGFLSLDLNSLIESRSNGAGGGVQLPLPLTALDATQPGFISDLEQLDAISNRTCDTIFIFYVKSGQKTADDILENMTSSENVCPHFVEFILSLGWPVNVATHVGWTGHLSTSFKVTETPSIADSGPHQSAGSRISFDGRDRVLYWSDATAEIAFVVPVKQPAIHAPFYIPDILTVSGHQSDFNNEDDLEIETAAFAGGHFERPSSTNERRNSPPPSGMMRHYDKPRTLSLDLDVKGVGTASNLHSGSVTFGNRDTVDAGKESPGSGGEPKHNRKGRFGSCIAGYDAKVLVIWLERYEDHLTVPLDNLLTVCNTGLEIPSVVTTTTAFPPRSHEKDTLVIYVHALQSGLFRIKLQGQVGKLSMAIPLVDGMVVSRRVLGTLVRQTTINMCLRKRLENDAYYPPHLRRKLKILDVIHKYGRGMSEPEFYTHLFQQSRQGVDD